MLFTHHSVTEIQSSYIHTFLFSSRRTISLRFFLFRNPFETFHRGSRSCSIYIARSLLIQDKGNSSQVSTVSRNYRDEKLSHLSSKVNDESESLIINLYINTIIFRYVGRQLCAQSVKIVSLIITVRGSGVTRERF